MKNSKPSADTPRSSTVRTDGRPSGDAVATTIAFGSTTSPDAATSSYQRVNCPTQSAARSASDSAPRAYVRRTPVTELRSGTR